MSGSSVVIPAGFSHYLMMMFTSSLDATIQICCRELSVFCVCSDVLVCKPALFAYSNVSNVNAVETLVAVTYSVVSMGSVICA